MAVAGNKTLAPDGALTMATVRTWLAAGRAALGEGDLLFDLSEVTASDSAALACVFELQRIAGRRGRVLRVVGLPDDLRKLANVYGVAELLPRDVAELV